jgi:hypothetical protein
VRAPEEDVGELLAKYDQMLANANLKPDFKDRVSRAIHAYRRALADNDDALTEFLILWSSMEGIDCVYHKVLPSRQGEFMDGVRTTFTRLGHPTVFATLESLRNAIAHGHLDLAAATQTATTNLPLVRSALLLMIASILKLRNEVRDRIVNRKSYKGNVTMHFRLNATIQFTPGDVGDFNGHPHMGTDLNGVQVKTKDGKISVTPDWRFNPQNFQILRGPDVQLRGDPGANVRVEGMGITVIPGNSDSSQ